MRSRSYVHLLIACGLGAAAFLLYFQRLDYVPPYLAHDEIIFSLHAHAIATTWHDLNGRLMPLFFHVAGGYWATPVAIYATALLLKIVPLTETVVRTPSALAGALDVALVYLIALQLSKSPWQAVAAAVFLALTPAHFIHSRMASDLIFPVPFLAGALLAVAMYFERRDLRLLFLATTIMGVGCYSYMGAAISMPLYLIALCGTILAFDERRLRALAVAIGGFVWPLLLLVPWLLRHPEQFGNQVQMYSIYDSQRLNPVAGLLDLLTYKHLTDWAVLYYMFFNPSFLFMAGDSSYMNSTRAAGVFLKPFIILLPVGLNYVVNRGRTPGSVMVFFGFVLAPCAALLVNEVKVNRELILLPCAAIIAAAGLFVMLRARFPLWRLVAIALLVASAYEFRGFYRHYMTEYRSASAFWFERNIRGALEQVIALDRSGPVPQIYISRTPRWIDWYWKWYLAKAGRPELLARTTYTVPGEIDPTTMPPHSVIFGEAEEVLASPVFRAAPGVVARIQEPDGAVSFIVFQR